MQICVFLTRSQCRVSDTQVTVKARGPLVYQVQEGTTIVTIEKGITVEERVTIEEGVKINIWRGHNGRGS